REAHRVLAPGGRFGLTVWGHLKASAGAWALRPFTLAATEKVANQAAMVALGRPGVGEELLAGAGFVGIERVEIPFAWEFPDPPAYARTLAATGPAFEAIQAVGEEEFTRRATALAEERVRAGLPLRAELKVVGFVARKPVEVSADHGFLAVPPTTPEVAKIYAREVAELGYVMNNARVWAHGPAAQDGLFALMAEAVRSGGLTFRQRAVLVAATASAIGDSYCSLAWGRRLAGEVGPEVAGAVLRGEHGQLAPAERALAEWARKAVSGPSRTVGPDVQALRDAGFDDTQIFAATLFVGLRLTFSTVNNALGALPDRGLRD